MDRRLVVNGRFLAQKMTGVNRYAFEMCNALHDLGIDFLVVAPRGVLSDYRCRFRVVQTGGFSAHLWEQIDLPRYMWRQGYRCLLVSFSGLGSLLYRPSVVTIHDLAYLENPRWFSVAYFLFYRFLTPIAARRAVRIVTVSEFSRSEITKRLGIEARKISVIQNGVRQGNPPGSVELPCDLQREKFLLVVSSLEPRKNLKRLIRAFVSLDLTDYRLVIVGKRGAAFANYSVSSTDSRKVRFTGHVSEDELARYYREAVLCVYPSLYEGFGLPNLEAMRHGCPVVTSGLEPHLEVCGDAAIYFDPLSEQSIRVALSKVIADSELRARLSIAGRARALAFSWEVSAQKLGSELARL